MKTMVRLEVWRGCSLMGCLRRVAALTADLKRRHEMARDRKVVLRALRAGPATLQEVTGGMPSHRRLKEGRVFQVLTKLRQAGAVGVTRRVSLAAPGRMDVVYYQQGSV